LKTLNLSNNALEEIPSEFSLLPNLLKLDLSHNRISKGLEHLNVLLEGDSLLSELLLDHNALNEWNAKEGMGRKLERLTLAHNNISEWPSWVKGLPFLQLLNISFNKIITIPELGPMKALQQIDLQNNKLSADAKTPFLSQFFNGKLYPQLVRLDINTNKLCALHIMEDSGLGSSNLKEILLATNELDSISNGLAQVTSLEVIDLQYNKFSSVPIALLALKQLRHLDLKFNNISTIAPELALLPLSKLFVEGNPLKTLPRAIIEKGTPALIQYLRSRLSPELLAKADSITTTTTTTLSNNSDSSSLIITSLEQLKREGEKVWQPKPQVLDVSNRNWSSLPLEIAQVFPSLQKLSLSKNTFQFFPLSSVQSLSSLSSLDLSYNKLSSLSLTTTTTTTSMSGGESLEVLNMNHNVLQYSSSSASSTATIFGIFKGLKHVDVSCNRLTELPLELFGLPLLSLQCSYNSITEISGKEVIQLSKTLMLLDISFNKLITIPAEEFVKCENLEHLNLQGNDISQVPPLLGYCTQLKTLQLQSGLVLFEMLV
jgi:Leucine-rich repeat (LRR) protein